MNQQQVKVQVLTPDKTVIPEVMMPMRETSWL